MDDPMRALLRLLPLTLFVAACTTPVPDSSAGPATTLFSDGTIETDSDGRCFAFAAGQQQTRITTELVEVVPELRDRNGVVTRPAVFREVTRPVTETVGQGARFETLCPQQYTSMMVATLQRALIVRRAYTGPVSETFDAATQAAVAAFQRDRGIDSPLLSVDTARDLGVLAIRVSP